ncbi:MAG: DUF1156 domain-containing protein [Syntrophales bacterium]
MHIWWARRPWGACRAVTLASLPPHLERQNSTVRSSIRDNEIEKIAVQALTAPEEVQGRQVINYHGGTKKILEN